MMPTGNPDPAHFANLSAAGSALLDSAFEREIPRPATGCDAPSLRTTQSGEGDSPVDLGRVPSTAKWGWALRHLPGDHAYLTPSSGTSPPNVGDVALFRVTRIGYHASVVVRDGRKLRIYPGDLLLGVFGNRYATDGFEAEVDGVSNLSLLTAGGMVGTVLSSHRTMGRPTSLELVGFVAGPTGRPLNLVRSFFRPVVDVPELGCPLLVVVGTGMNAGKTTVVSQIVHDASARGLRVAAGKLTGSVSNRDADEMRAASAASVVDFSDYGFPSTYLADPVELAALWRTILERSARDRPDLIVMEIADGLVERETAILLGDPAFRGRVSGVVLAADSSLGALWAVQRLTSVGLAPLAVSGALTSAPLAVREYREESTVPIFESGSGSPELADHVLGRLGLGPSRLAARVEALGGSASAPVQPHAHAELP